MSALSLLLFEKFTNMFKLKLRRFGKLPPFLYYFYRLPSVFTPNQTVESISETTKVRVYIINVYVVLSVTVAYIYVYFVQLLYADEVRLA